MTKRVQSIPARHYFAEHTHEWNQVVYAISGVLTVVADGRSFVISPEHAAWLSPGTVHRVGSFLGAEFRSLWLADAPGGPLCERSATVFGMSPFLKALILEASALDAATDSDGYFGRIYQLILDQLLRARPVSSALSWPQSATLSELCEALYNDPADPRGPKEWGVEFGMLGRTLARKFLADMGVTMRSWRRQLRLFRAIEFLENGMDVTRTAMELGYNSTSAFIYAFRSDMKLSPLAYMRKRSMPTI
ncbi:HTH-type transcriptional regulator NimR [Achromobacter xylosoxidans]|uniref:HTH-type transcriptional regulator NimR n=2 Tax=Alcaligenaceae TaxID=506 RepID=A0A446CSV0_9BURK|nr:helix-turn-helix transcriptional regulator [Pseudacidovorax sp. NFM-22]BEG78303.1 HTH-type transcriptional regulator NimR [Achromobacter xylosoxidans]SSW70944.1 HTH-type transcriptional regulator NimR [Achromobacter veterisilvae]